MSKDGAIRGRWISLQMLAKNIMLANEYVEQKECLWTIWKKDAIPKDCETYNELSYRRKMYS